MTQQHLNAAEAAVRVHLHLPNVDNGFCDSEGCSPCRKSRCQVCNVICSATTFVSRVTNKECRITFSLNCDSSNVVYMLECSFAVYNMLAVHVLRLELGLIIISHTIAGLMGCFMGTPRLTFFGILPERVIGGSLKMLELLS